MKVSTKITTLFDDDAQELMTGSLYPIYSHDSKPIISERTAMEVLQTFFELKLNRYYACIQKAKIAATRLGIGHIHIGSLMVDSYEEGVMYGYLYNPPLELHAWVEIDTKIIDFALAGTIEKGLATKDEVGPFLINRKPIILAGVRPPWAHYTTHEIVSLDHVRLLNIETAKELLNK